MAMDNIAAPLFQSTHPRGVRLRRPRPHPARSSISIHAPTWGATNITYPIVVGDQHFNPRTHVGCDDLAQAEFDLIDRFQSTHPRGVRRNAVSTMRSIRQFQSTHPRGVRRLGPHQGRAVGKISIHAPTWGATTRPTPRSSCGKDFNPRTHVGCDVVRGTPQRGGGDFNPRTHVGCDSDKPHAASCMMISIHAPTWGATARSQGLQGIHDNFNPRTHVGCDGHGDFGARHNVISIHAPTWGATHKDGG